MYISYYRKLKYLKSFLVYQCTCTCMSPTVYLSVNLYAGSPKQRDSAVSCSSQSDGIPTSCTIPAPPIVVHNLPYLHFAAVYDILRESIFKAHQQHKLSSTPSSSPAESSLASTTLMQPEASRTTQDFMGLDNEETLGEDRSRSPSLPARVGVGKGGHWTLPEETNGVIPAITPPKQLPDSPRLRSRTLPRRLALNDVVAPMSMSQDTDSITQDSRYSIDYSPTTARRNTTASLERRGTLDTHLTALSSSLRKGQRPPISLYSNQAASSTAAMGPAASGSVRVKYRPNPTATRSLRRAKKSSTITAAIVPHDRSRVKIVKLVLAGDDNLVGNAARAFAQLRTQEPNLFLNLDVQFFHVPLTEAVPRSSSKHASASGDLPEPANEGDGREGGDDVQLGRYLGHMDSWYERNVTLAVYNTLRLLPSVSASPLPPSLPPSLSPISLSLPSLPHSLH